MFKKYFYLFVVFAVWSTSSAIVVNFRGFLPPFQSASLVTLIATLVVTVFFLIINPNVIADIFKCDIRQILYLGLIGFFGLFLYPVFYFYGLHSPRPLEANIINYFWPLLAVLFGFALETESITGKKMAGVLLGFLGVLITTSSLRGVGDHVIPEFDVGYSPAYILAGLGAMSYGIYTVLLKKIRIVDKKNKALDIRSKFVAFLFWASFLHLLYNVKLLTVPSELYNLIGLNHHRLLYLMIYAVLNFGIAYLFWAKAVDTLPLSNITLLAFLIPTFSTVVLTLWNQLELSVTSVYGLLLILVGMYVHQDIRRFITPLAGTWICLVIFGLLTFLIPCNTNLTAIPHLLTTLHILIAVFAILSGFILSRVVRRYSTENELFISIEDNLSRVCNAIKPDSDLTNKIDDYMNFLIESNYNLESFSLSQQMSFEGTHQTLINTIKESIHKLKGFSKSMIANLNEEICNLEEKVSRWKYLRGESIAIFEWLILYSLVSMLVILFYQVRLGTFLYQIITIVFASSLVLYLLTIREYDLRRPRKKVHFLLLTQRISKALSRYPYVPKEVLSTYCFTTNMFGKRKFFLRTKDDNGKYIDVSIQPEFSYYRLLYISIIITTVVAVLYTLFRKYC